MGRRASLTAALFFLRMGMEMIFRVDIPEALARELQQAASETQLTPESFAAQAVETVLASRRLPHVAVGRCGPRVLDIPTAEPEAEVPEWTPELLLDEDGPDFPLLDDTSALEDIT